MNSKKSIQETRANKFNQIKFNKLNSIQFNKHSHHTLINYFKETYIHVIGLYVLSRSL